MGPGYEQCIHVLMFEILRHSIVLRNEVPNTDMDGIMDAALAFATPNVDPCPSGNQAWAARKLAHEALTGQWAAMLNKAGTDCCIMVSNMWPRVRP
jgi:hypothetical protein